MRPNKYVGSESDKQLYGSQAHIGSTKFMRPIVFLFSFVSPETKLSRWESMATGDQKKNKEPCKKEACDIQACLTKNNFNPQRY